jgi:hypothetical protein
MRVINRPSLLFVVALAIFSSSTIAILRAQKQGAKTSNQITDEASQFPIVDFYTPEELDASKREKREKKSKKYDKPVMEVDERLVSISMFAPWGADLSALPVDKSVAIIVGQITDRAAYLSTDKTNVYSEVTVSIEKVLMNSSGVTLAIGDSIAVERDGGRVRFPSGHITFARIPGQGMPLLGRRYVLFLTHKFPLSGVQEKDLYIQTGYELRDGKVFPLDYPSSKSPLSVTYKGADEATLMNDLLAAIQKSQ